MVSAFINVGSLSQQTRCSVVVVTADLWERMQTRQTRENDEQWAHASSSDVSSNQRIMALIMHLCLWMSFDKHVSYFFIVHSVSHSFTPLVNTAFDPNICMCDQPCCVLFFCRTRRVTYSCCSSFPFAWWSPEACSRCAHIEEHPSAAVQCPQADRLLGDCVQQPNLLAVWLRSSQSMCDVLHDDNMLLGRVLDSDV